jgi:hypothetical protein
VVCTQVGFGVPVGVFADELYFQHREQDCGQQVSSTLLVWAKREKILNFNKKTRLFIPLLVCDVTLQSMLLSQTDVFDLKAPMRRARNNF